MKDSTIRAAAQAVANAAIGYSETRSKLALASLLGAREAYNEVINKLIPAEHQQSTAGSVAPYPCLIKLTATSETINKTYFGPYRSVCIQNGNVLDDNNHCIMELASTGGPILSPIWRTPYVKHRHLEWHTLTLSTEP